MFAKLNQDAQRLILLKGNFKIKSVYNLKWDYDD